MATYTNDAFLTGLANGTTVTASNTGGGTNTAFNAVTGTVTTSNAHPDSHTTMGYHVAATVGATADVRLPLGAGTTGNAFRMYFYLTGTAAPTSTQELVQLGSTGQNYLGVMNTGVVRVQLAGAGAYTGTYVLLASTLYRIEAWWTIAASGAEFHYALYLGDSGTAVDSFDTSAGNTGTTNPTMIYIGKHTSTGNWTDIYFSSVAANDAASGFIGASTSSNGAVTAPHATSTLTARVPSVTAGTGGSVTAVRATSSGHAVAPVVSTSITISGAGPAVGSMTARAPTVGVTSSSGNVTAVRATSSWQARVPAVSGTTGSAAGTVNAAHAILLLSARSPRFTAVDVVDDIQVDGISMRCLGFNIPNRTGTFSMPARRGDDLVLPGASGYTFVPNKPFEAGSGVLQVWATGADPTTGAVPATQLLRQAQLRDNVETIMRFFTKPWKLSNIRARQPDSTWRHASVQWSEWDEPTIVAGSTRAEWSIGFTIPSTWWADEAQATNSATAGATLPKVLNLTAFADMTGFVEDATITVTGPITNPRVTDSETSSWVQYTGTVATGQTWVVDAGAFTSTVGGTSALQSTTHSGAWKLYVVPNCNGTSTTPQAVLSGTGGGASTNLTISGYRRWVNG